jgi:hypothetical protein
MSLEDELVKEIKLYINNDDLEGLKNFWDNTEFDVDLGWDYVFEKVYLHAALKKKKNFCEWLDTLFPKLSKIEQMAIRQMFSYAKYLLNK